jgi:hypothetical protein
VSTAAGLSANTTINSSIKPFVVPNTVYSRPNTTINSSVHPFVVPNTVYSQPNTTINSSVHPYVVPNTAYSTKPSPALVQSMAAQTAAGKAASQVTIASQAAIAQNARFVPKGVLTVPPQVSSSYALNAALAADTAGGSSGPNIAAAAQMQSLTDLNAANAQMQAQAINTQLQAQQMQSATDRQNILVNTQTSIFEMQQNVAANQAKTAEKMFNNWDQYIGN